MEDIIQSLQDAFQTSPELFFLGAIGLGVMIFIYGLSATFAGPTDEVRRMAAGGRNRDIAADYDLVQEDDTIDILGLTEFAAGKPLTVRLNHADGTTSEFLVNHSYNDAQIEWFHAGSALNLIRKQAGV